MSATATNQPIYSPETAIAALKSDDNQIRYYAAWWVGKHQVGEACEVLCEALQDDRYRTPHGGYPLRRQAARALGQLKNPETVPALIEALGVSTDVQLQEAAIQALAAIGDSRAIAPLVALIEAGGNLPYEALIEALASLEVWSMRDRVEPFLANPSERVQCAAARYFYLMTGEAQYLDRIIQMLGHDNPYLRWAAAFDLGAIGHVRAAKAIVDAKIANSLKLLNLKRILSTLVEDNRDGVPDRPEKIGFLIQSIDDLLLQL
jgi:bilin biosynthesis PecE protein